MEPKVRGLISPYVGFLVDKLNKIYEAWDNGDEELALSRAVKLTFFLVDQLKEKLKPEVDRIIREMNDATEKEGVGFLTEEAVRSSRAKAVAQKWLPVFLDKLTTLFDERDYFEVHRKYLEEEAFREFKKDEG